VDTTIAQHQALTEGTAHLESPRLLVQSFQGVLDDESDRPCRNSRRGPAGARSESGQT